MDAATRVFHLPEVLEQILLALPCDTTHQELSAMRTIMLGQTASHTWHQLVRHSTPIRQRLYRSTPGDAHASGDWDVARTLPPARPNPWIPDLLLHQRSWGSAFPFDVGFAELEGEAQLRRPPRLWTFTFEISRAQFERLPPPGTWREMLAVWPPFAECWYTRCLYELGSGRAPFVTHLDYDPALPKSRQARRKSDSKGITLGAIADAVTELFDGHLDAKYVMVESLRLPRDRDGSLDLSDDRPTTKSYLPGSSSADAGAWQ